MQPIMKVQVTCIKMCVCVQVQKKKKEEQVPQITTPIIQRTWLLARQVKDKTVKAKKKRATTLPILTVEPEKRKRK